MARQRPEIPAAIKRQLRQDAGFGCCICGNPVFQYHHIREYSTVPEHDPAHMMVLCPNHHHEATVGALPESDQRKWKEAPFNIAAGHLEGLLRVTAPGIAVRVGTIDFVGTGFKLSVDSDALLELHRSETGLLELTADVRDKDDSVLLTIERNEWTSGDPLPWDFEFGHRWLTLRRKARDIAIQIDTRTEPTEFRGELWAKGQHFALTPSELRFEGVVKNVSVAEVALVGIGLDVDTHARNFCLVPTYGEGFIVSWPDRAERLERAYAVLANFEEGRGLHEGGTT